MKKIIIKLKSYAAQKHRKEKSRIKKRNEENKESKNQTNQEKVIERFRKNII